MKSELGNQLRWNSAQRNKTLKKKKKPWNEGRMKGVWKWLCRDGLKTKVICQEGGRGLFYTEWDSAVLLRAADLAFSCLSCIIRMVKSTQMAYGYSYMLST